jgi:enoyl-CoA hydratase/carnithine racemase
MKKYMVEHEEFSVYSENSICYVNLTGHTTKNAISFEVASIMKKISNAPSDNMISPFEEYLKAQEVVLIVVRSLVRNIFSSGGNLNDLVMAKRDHHPNYANSIHNFCKMLSRISYPTITLLAGNAYGGGVELALATDFRWSVGRNIEFHFTQTKFGVPGGWGGMKRMQELNPSLNTRKVNFMFLSQDILKLNDLIRFQFVDKEFEEESSCYKVLNRWRDGLLKCNVSLKADFFRRCEISSSKIEEHDGEFFKEYFLTSDHKRNIKEFLKGKKRV